jgi:UDPglucose 6-dehydrogenase
VNWRRISLIQDLMNPDRVLIGGPETPEGIMAIQTLVRVYANWVPREQILTTNLWSNELSKLVVNAFLAQRLSSINSISALCEATGAGVTEISRAVLWITASQNVSCNVRWIWRIVFPIGHPQPGLLVRNLRFASLRGLLASSHSNERLSQEEFSEEIDASMFNTVTGKKIAVLGYTFKNNTGSRDTIPKKTGDVRETPSLAVVNCTDSK